MRPGSLRARLVLGALAVSIAFSLLFGAFALWRVHHASDQAISASLSSRLELARDQVSRNGTITQDAGSPNTDLVQVIGPDGTVRANSPAFTGADPLVNISRVQRSRSLHARITLRQTDVDLAVLAVPLHLSGHAGSPAGTGALVVAVDAAGFDSSGGELLWILIVGLIVVIVAIGFLSWTLAGRALRSVARLTESAEAVEPHDLSSGLPVPDNDAELARLVGALNRMLVRLDESHGKELAFAADASHRLRTPVATLRAEAELALREHDPEPLRAALENIVRDSDQLTSIVDGMLARSRTREHALEPVIAGLTGGQIRWGRRAELAAVALTVRIADDIPDDLRCAGMIEVVEPIVDNALRFTPEGGLVAVAVSRDDKLLVMVTNNGPGIPAGIESQLFDAWVSSRDASVAGGLGLWLARETARDLGGDVVLVSGEPDATTFKVVLPAG